MSANDISNLRSLAADRAESDPLVAYALDGCADEIERLRTEVAGKDAALDAAENDIGRPWRFWAKKCREMAQRKERE